MYNRSWGGNLLGGELDSVVFTSQMSFTVLWGLEGNWADGAFVQDLTMFLLNVSLLSLKGLENHFTVKTPGGEGSIVPISSPIVLYNTNGFNNPCISHIVTYLYQALRA